MTPLLDLSQRHSKPFWLVAGVMCTAALGFIDYETGYEVSFSLFYLLPVSLVTWTAGRRFGLIMSLLGAVVWQTADLYAGHDYSHPAIPFWNALIRLGFFTIVTYLLSSLRGLLQHEHEMAHMDPLTGAVNSRFFHELMASEVNRSHRYARPLTVAYFDLDDFKAVNDRFGHQVGDRVLCAVVQYARQRLRQADVIARLGGDEFALVLPETDRPAAEVVVSRIRAGLLGEMQRRGWPTTLSIGVLTCFALPGSTDEMLRLADGLMYSSKRAGKNTVSYSTYPEPVRDELPELTAAAGR